MKRPLALLSLLALAGALAFYLAGRDGVDRAGPASPVPSPSGLDSTRDAPPGLHVEGAAREPASAIEVPALGKDREENASGLTAATRTRTLSELRVEVRERPSGVLVPGVRVRTVDEDPEVEAVTGEDGVALLEIAGGAGPVQVVVDKPGYRHRGSWFPRRGLARLQISRSVALRGLVVDDVSGSPVAGALVELFDGCKHCERGTEGRVDASCVSDESGRYELPSAPAHWPHLSFRVTHEAFAPLTKGFELRTVEGHAGYDFRLERGIEVWGVVVDAASGVGIEGARAGRASTDAGGRFRYRALPDPEDGLDVHVRADGYASLHATLSPGALAEREPLTFELRRGVAVEGTIRDLEGLAAPGASIRLYQDDELRQVHAASGEEIPELAFEQPSEDRTLGFSVSASATADDAGRYRIEGLWPRLDHVRFEASMGGARASLAVERLAGSGEVSVIDAVLEPDPPAVLAWIEGQVRFLGKHTRLPGKVVWSRDGETGAAALRFGARFGFKLPPGPVELRVELDGLPITDGSRVERDLVAGENDPVLFDLSPATGTITGTVRYPDGSPAADIPLRATCRLPDAPKRQQPSLRFTTRSAADGSYALDVAVIGHAYRVVAGAENSEVERADVRPGERDVDFEVGRRGLLHYRVREASTGDSLGGAHTLAWRSQGRDDFSRVYTRMTAPDSEGWRELELPAGPCELRASPQSARFDLLPCERSIVVPADGTPVRVEFLLESGWSLEVRLSESSEQLPKDVVVLLVEDEYWNGVDVDLEERVWRSADLGERLFDRSLELHNDRSCRVVGLSPGLFRLHVFSSSDRELVFAPSTVEIGPGHEGSVTLSWFVDE